MTPEQLADLHARAFSRLRAWSGDEFRALLNGHGVILAAAPHAFAIGRVIADEAELLTLATDPKFRRTGLGATCLAGFESRAFEQGARRVLLEVDCENMAALALYHGRGYAEIARRAGYYRLRDGRRLDAVIMAKALPA